MGIVRDLPPGTNVQELPGVSYNVLLDSAVTFLIQKGFKIVSIRRKSANHPTPDIFAVHRMTGVTLAIDIATDTRTIAALKRHRLGNWRFVVCPPSIIQPKILPENWGVIWINRTGSVVYSAGLPFTGSWSDRVPFQPVPAEEMAYISRAIAIKPPAPGMVRLPIRGTVK